MTSLSILDLPIRDIDVPADRARDFDQTSAEMLAGVIAAQGPHHPIRVRPNGDRYTLISGLLRLRAFELLQRDMIPASVSRAETDAAARLEEVMENLGRAELIALDRCHHLYELKKAWLALHPEAAAGGDHGNQHTGGKTQTLRFASDVEIFGFGKRMADKIGLSVRTIETGVKIWTDLAPSSRLRLAGTDLATKQTELKALSEEKPAMQVKILDLIFGDEHPDVQNVNAALAFLERGRELTPAEKQFRAVDTAFGKLEDAALDMVLASHVTRVIGGLKRLGHI